MHVLGGCPSLATLARCAGRLDAVIVLGGPGRRHRLRPGGCLAAVQLNRVRAESRYPQVVLVVHMSIFNGSRNGRRSFTLTV
jgi:hypothetical protein